MDEVFRFMTVRNVQLAEPSVSIDLGGFLGRQPGQVDPLPPKLLRSPIAAADLNYATQYGQIDSRLHAPGFDPTTTTAAVEAIATWIPNDQKALVDNKTKPDKKYASDKQDIAVALIAAHQNPPADNRIEVLTTYARVMAIIDALIANVVINDSATISAYFSRILTVPPGLLTVAPYNPFVVPAGVADLLCR